MTIAAFVPEDGDFVRRPSLGIERTPVNLESNEASGGSFVLAIGERA